MKNREDVLRLVDELRRELEQIARRLDRVAAMIADVPEVGGLYREQIRARRATSEESEPEAG